MLASVENRLQITLDGLTADEVASLAAALRTEPLDEEAIQGLYRRTGGHPLYLRTILVEEAGSDPRAPGRPVLPRSLAAVIGDRLAGLPADTRTILEMLSVLNLRIPLAQLGQAAGISSPSAAIEPAVVSGLISDLTASVKLARRGATLTLERHARLAEEAADSLDYGQEKLYAAMARALVYQAAGDYLGMADALGHWRDDAALDGRSRAYAVLWRPLLIEGLIGSGQTERAAAVLDQLREGHGQVGYLRPDLAWLEGWLAEQRDAPEEARRIYSEGEESAGPQSPVYAARLLLAHGRLLRRTGQRRLAVERLRQAHGLYQALRAAPFIARTEEELAACHLPGNPAKKQSVLALTSRETEVAHLVGKGLSNPEIAAELFISRKAVEYHLGNVYAKCGLRGRQELRRFVEQWRQPAAV
jgi:DNA-binding CsgD family transcriptional regulator